MPWESGLLPDAIQIIEPGGLEPADDALMAVGGKAFNLLKLAADGLSRAARLCVADVDVRGLDRGGSAFARRLPDARCRSARQAGAGGGAGFGDPKRPLLVSVRSGAPVSMPGMLDTVLDVGLTRANISGLIAQSGNPRMAWDCYLRLIESYATTVHGLHAAPFDEAGARIMAAACCYDIAGTRHA